MERTLKNGKEYRFEEIFKDYIKAYCFYDNRWNPLTVSFKTWKEAEAWCDEQDYKFEHPVKWVTSCPPPDEYDDYNKWYGD